MSSHCKIGAEASASALLADIKMEPPEQLLDSDSSLQQSEPVDLSLHKPKNLIRQSQSPLPSTSVSTPPPVISLSGLGSAIPAVLSPGSILATTQGSSGQRILHVIHTIPSVNLPSKMGGLQTIPVVVQSLPVVYTTLPTDGVTAHVTVPLLGADGKTTGENVLLLCCVLLGVTVAYSGSLVTPHRSTVTCKRAGRTEVQASVSPHLCSYKHT